MSSVISPNFAVAPCCSRLQVVALCCTVMQGDDILGQRNSTRLTLAKKWLRKWSENVVKQSKRKFT